MAIRIHNQLYVTVAERVQFAHADEGFSMLSEEVFSIGDRHFVRVVIDVKGKQYIGSAEIKFGAKPNTPDGTNPLECAATSAVGRALGFASYGSIESIASADEIVRGVPVNEKPERIVDSQPPRQLPPSTTDQPARPQKPAPYPNEKEVVELKKMVKAAGIASDVNGWLSWKCSVLQAVVSDNDLTLEHIATLKQALPESMAQAV